MPVLATVEDAETVVEAVVDAAVEGVAVEAGLLEAVGFLVVVGFFVGEGFFVVDEVLRFVVVTFLRVVA